MRATADFDRFLAAVLDPVPPEQLVDLGFNYDARAARRERWLHASWDLEIAVALLDLHRIARIERYARRWPAFAVPRAVFTGEDNAAWWVHECRARLILTPAPGLAAVTWKRRQRESVAVRAHLPRTAREKDDGKAILARVIAEDEAFLAAHPTSRRPRARRRPDA